MLIDLNLTGCGITDHGIAILRHHKKLKYLDLAELPDITDDGISVSIYFVYVTCIITIENG
jgi:hypothetical protein